MKISFELSKKFNMLKDLGYNLNNDSVFLDFGCGSGKMVQELCELGYNAYGIDIDTRCEREEGVDTEGMIAKGLIRLVSLDNYKLPFEDNSITFIFSHCVFEHVGNYSESLSEMSRILKPKGFCLHIFPSKYRPIEPHIYVPFSGVIQSYWWIYFWICLGVKNEWTDCPSKKHKTERFYNYIKNETNYLSKKELIHEFRMKFEDVRFCENIFNKNSPQKGKYLYSLSKIFPFIPFLYSTFHTRVVFTSLPINKNYYE